MKHYLLFYEAGDDYAERRIPFRTAHLAHARQAHQRGDLVLAGALADPADGAVLFFQGSSPDVVAAFAQADPYVMNGIVTANLELSRHNLLATEQRHKTNMTDDLF